MVDFAKLAEPLSPEDIEWRIDRVGRKNGKIWAIVFAYPTSRAIQDRLDDAVGPENWENEFRPWRENSQLCGITIHTPSGPRTKWDGASNTEYEPIKGGLSDSEKRAAVQWGIFRYGYRLGVLFANINEQGIHSSKVIIDGKEEWIKWDPPELPAWAVPKDTKHKAAAKSPAKKPGKKDAALEASLICHRMVTEAHEAKDIAGLKKLLKGAKDSTKLKEHKKNAVVLIESFLSELQAE